MNTVSHYEWSDLIVYQIYPRSFCDSDADGIGDLNGITSKLDYLSDLGVNAVWLCPCYKSPNEDNGYDIADFRDIMDEFGTLDDWNRMIKEMHKRGIRLIMDLVPNHTSSEHKWFKESRKSRTNPYSDYYVWADQPLNDWQSKFLGSAWEYDDVRGQYYLHSYAVHQPDLNWDNPKVRKEICDVIDYWVDRGVDGFRIDVIDQISKDYNGRSCFGPHLHEYIHEMFGREKTEKLFTVGECWANDMDEILRHCAPERGELKTLFQFDHFKIGRSSKFSPKPFAFSEVRDVVSNWVRRTEDNGLLYTLFTDNHDQPRFLSRFTNDRELRYEAATMLAGMFYLLPGVPFIYQGQEIGVTNSHYDDIGDFRDIETLNYYKENAAKTPEKDLLEAINFGSRDNARRPMPWNTGKNYGFSEADENDLWTPLYDRGDEINVETDLSSEKSILRFYRSLLRIRSKNTVVPDGTYEEISVNDGCYVYKRSENGKNMLVVCNFDKPQTLDLTDLDGKYGRSVISNYGLERPVSGKYRPYELSVFTDFDLNE